MQEGAIKTIGKYSYFTQKCLGQGSFGKVFQGYQNTTKEKIAVKKVDFKTIQKDPYLQKAIHQQIRILSKFKHPNVVQLMEVLNSKRSLYIIMEYCKDGDLKKHIKRKERQGLPQGEVLAIMKQVVRGYQELARNNTIHRDLKPANILINNGVFKICDFGFSKIIKDPSVANKTCVGSPIYMAPQILQKKDYSAKCDIWSLGIIFFELLHGTVPWTARSERQLLGKIKTEQFKCTKASPETEKVIRHMLEVAQQRRASLSDLQLFFQLDFEKTNSNMSNLNSNWQDRNGSFQRNGSVQRNGSAERNGMVQQSLPTKLLNRNYFQELSWRYFVCVQLRTSLPFLNRYNFKQNLFQRYIVLVIVSVLSSLKKRKAEIERIHEKEAIARIKQDYETYSDFKEDLFEYLNEGYATCQILKEFDLTDISSGNYTDSALRKAQHDLLKNSHSILKQIQEETKLIQPGQEAQRIHLLSIAQLILDMVLLNEKQSRTGIAQIEQFLSDRSVDRLQKRVNQKYLSFKDVRRIEFF